MLAGYSGTPLLKKLGIKPGIHVALRGQCPEGLSAEIAALPATLSEPSDTTTPAEVALIFTRTAADLESAFAELIPRIVTAGMIWACWPKRTSGVATDLGENQVRDIGLATGWVDVKVCAIDATWSGLKFVRRLKDRA